MDKDKLISAIKEFNNSVVVLPFEIPLLVFELNTKINCFYCGKYNNSWRCPPKIPAIDYKAMMAEFDYAAFVYQTFKVTDLNRDSIRAESTNTIHRTLLHAEKVLFDNNCSNALSFIGGSCKLCKAGCGAEKCNNPYHARMPVEATGINVIKTLAKLGVEIRFPITDELKRVGMLLWNN